MKSSAFMSAVCIGLAVSFTAHAADKAKPATPPMDPKAMEEMMMKAAAPGPPHQRLQKLAGEWNATVESTMDPSQPPQKTTSVAVITTLMDGRYVQEVSTGEMMGRPFSGMGITGYDNLRKKYVSMWIDNFGTGIMTSEGTPDASGNVINWTGESPDPMSGKMAKFRMVTRFLSDDKHTFGMFGAGPDGKETKMMEITYERKM